MDSLEFSTRKKKDDVIADQMRADVLAHSKEFKTQWVKLGQLLYTIWNDKFYHAWGYEKFEDYVQREVGLKKQMAIRLLKTYSFLEQSEPSYLKEEFKESREAIKVPGIEELNVLRMAQRRKELLKEDLLQLKKAVFDKGKDASAVRKDLTAMMKERKVVDPDEEREKRNDMAIRRLVTSLKSFTKDMETLKLIPDEIVKEAIEFMSKLEGQIK